MRKLLIALLACMLGVTSAHAQKTKAEISSEIITLFPDNTSGAITPLTLRTVTNDIATSIMPTAPVVANNTACFSGTTGLLKDCGVAPSLLIVGTTAVSSGISNGLLYNNGGILANTTAASGGLLNTDAFGAPAVTPTPVLGVAGSSVGSLGFQNLTSGTVTLQPPTGALGAAVISLPGLTSTLATLANPETFTNKTLSSPVFSGTATGTNVIPLSVLANLAANTFIGSLAGGAPTALTINGGTSCTNALTWTNGVGFGCNVLAGTGTVTQVTCGTGLTGGTFTASGTCAVDPAFGSWKLLNTLTASASASLSDTTNLTSSFKDYEIVLENILPATTSTDCYIQVQVSGTFQTTGYLSVVTRSASAATSTTSPTINIPCSGTGGQVSNAGQGISGILTMLGPVSGTSVAKIANGQFTYLNAGSQAEMAVSGGYYNATTAVTGVRVIMSSGNITSGTMKIYGRN